MGRWHIQLKPAGLSWQKDLHKSNEEPHFCCRTNSQWQPISRVYRYHGSLWVAIRLWVQHTTPINLDDILELHFFHHFNNWRGHSFSFVWSRGKNADTWVKKLSLYISYHIDTYFCSIKSSDTNSSNTWCVENSSLPISTDPCLWNTKRQRPYGGEWIRVLTYLLLAWKDAHISSSDVWKNKDLFWSHRPSNPIITVIDNHDLCNLTKAV